MIMDVSRLEGICKQVEYYFSDQNLVRDKFFRDLIAANTDGWVKAENSILTCKRIQDMQVENSELIQALQSSTQLAVDVDQDGWCWARRTQPFRSCSSKGGKGKGKNGRKSDARSRPEYDSSTPCGYHMAGYCRRGAGCGCQHSVPYALAIREQWLHPQCDRRKQQLEDAAVTLIGEAAIKKAKLFPRAFSQRLEIDCKECDSFQKRRWNKGGGAADDEESVVVFEGSFASEEISSRIESLRYLLVLDLEGKDEIIEFPVIVVDAVAGCEISRFQRYVRPVHLFDGCEINSDSPAVPFALVLEEFDQWLSDTIGRRLNKLGDDAAFLTCGDWDCKHIHKQCGISNIPVPAGFQRWVNIKHTYENEYGGRYTGMRSMLAKLKLLNAEGHVVFGFHHLGMHDVENIGRCVLHLLREERCITVNGHFRFGKGGYC